MMFVQATTGAGGWPMSVWLTPDLKPFFGGTYFPPTSRWGRPGFVDVLEQLARAWRTERVDLGRTADDVLDAAAETRPGADERRARPRAGGRPRRRRDGHRRVCAGVRRAPRRLRRRAEVSAAGRAAVSPATPTR